MCKLKMILLLAAILTFSACSKSDSDLLQCWMETYETEFSFIKQLDKLEQIILDQGQINGTSGEDYMKLFEDIASDKLNLNFNDITVEKFVREQPFKNCVAKHDLMMKDDKTIKYGLLFSIYVVLAREHATIKVELTEHTELIFNGHYANIADFNDLVYQALAELEKQGIPREEIILRLKVADNVKMRVISDIQVKLQELNIRKVKYENYLNDN